MNKTYQQQFYEDFLKEHGKHIRVPNTNYLIFDDGALIEWSGLGLGVSMDPPTDAYERAKKITQFHQLVLNEAVREFDNLKHQLRLTSVEAKRQGNAGMLPDEEATLAQLKRMQSIVRRAKKKFEAAKAKEKAVEPYWVTDRLAALNADGSRKAEEFRSLIESVQI